MIEQLNLGGNHLISINKLINEKNYKNSWRISILKVLKTNVNETIITIHVSGLNSSVKGKVCQTGGKSLKIVYTEYLTEKCERIPI